MSEPQRTRVSKSEYARRRGVHPAMVTRWAKAGRIVLDGKAVLLEESDAALEAGLNPIHGGRRTGSAASNPATSKAPASGFIRSKERQTDLSADLLELRLQRERGEVHETAACGQAIAAALSGPLAKLDSLFMRIAPRLAAENDVRRIQDMGEDEVSRIRQEIADALRALAATKGSNSHQ